MKAGVRPLDCPTSAWNRCRDIFDAARIKPAVVHVESHPYLPQWELLNYCKENGIVLQAFAALGHSQRAETCWKIRSSPPSPSESARPGAGPARLGDPARTALLTTSKTPSRIRRTLTFPRFLKTRCGRLAKESSRGSGSIRGGDRCSRVHSGKGRLRHNRRQRIKSVSPPGLPRPQKFPVDRLEPGLIRLRV